MIVSKESVVSRQKVKPTLTDKFQKQRDNTKMPPKTSITQRLQTALGRSVGVKTANELVWLNRFTGSQTFD